jgi:DNA-binding transcriptional LysR family regulator
MDLLTCMRTFVAVVEQAGFSAAAEVLNTSRGSVSKKIAELERHLGARLLNRTTRSMRLTEAGRTYYESVLSILEAIDRSEHVVAGYSDTAKGVLRVTAPVSFGIRFVGPAVGDFCRQHRDMQVDLALSDRFVNLLDEGFDLAIRIGQMDDSTLVAQRLGTVRVGIYASPGYVRYHGTPVSPSDLKQEHCLRYRNRDGGRQWLLNSPDGQLIEVAARGAVSSNSGECLATLAAAGLGVVLLPDFIAEPFVLSGQLQAILPDYQPRSAGIFAVYPSRRFVPAKVRLFIEQMRTWLAHQASVEGN